MCRYFRGIGHDKQTTLPKISNLLTPSPCHVCKVIREGVDLFIGLCIWLGKVHSIEMWICGDSAELGDLRQYDRLALPFVFNDEALFTRTVSCGVKRLASEEHTRVERDADG